MPPPLIIRAVLPSRQVFVDRLRAELPDAVWCFDQTRNAMDTFLLALAMAGDGAAVHMEDDVQLCTGFREKLAAVIAAFPSRVVQFFSMRKADLELGSRWDTTFSMSQCFYLPAGYSKMILQFQPTWRGIEKDPTGYDLMVRDWLKSRRERYWIHVPSLVDHAVTPSLIDPRRSRKRQSKTFRP